MITLHPSFDPVKKLWTARSAKGGRVQAPTIRALLAKFPKGTKVQDYYPNGDTPRIERGMADATYNLKNIGPRHGMNARFIPKTNRSRDHA